MKINNVLLYEKHDVTTSEVVQSDNNQTMFIHGHKIYRIVKPILNDNDELVDHEVLCEYNAKSDSIDLSVLRGYIGYQMVSVDVTKYDTFEWHTVTIVSASDDNDIFLITDNRKCTDKEIEICNQLFPEYYDNCYFIKNGKKITPKDNN